MALSVETSATFIAAGVKKELSRVQFSSCSTYTESSQASPLDHVITIYLLALLRLCAVPVSVAVAVCLGLNTPRVAADVAAATATVASEKTVPALALRVAYCFAKVLRVADLNLPAAKIVSWKRAFAPDFNQLTVRLS